LVLEVSGETIDDGSDYVIPPVKYCFAWKGTQKHEFVWKIIAIFLII
jgi:hypothetical protein